MRKYVVEIQPDCWLAPWPGDPGRTCVLNNARIFGTIGKATGALNRMRDRNPERRFVSARVVAVDVTTTIAMDVEVTVTDLRDIPVIRAEAERVAGEYHNTALARVINRTDLATQAPTLPAWEHLSPSYQEMRVEAHLDLLCDLTRPASRDAIIRMCIEADIRGVDDQAEISAIITEWTNYRDDIERIAYLAPVSLGASND